MSSVKSHTRCLTNGSLCLSEGQNTAIQKSSQLGDPGPQISKRAIHWPSSIKEHVLFVFRILSLSSVASIQIKKKCGFKTLELWTGAPSVFLPSFLGLMILSWGNKSSTIDRRKSQARQQPGYALSI